MTYPLYPPKVSITVASGRRLIEDIIPPLREMKLAVSVQLGRMGATYDSSWIEVFDSNKEEDKNSWTCESWITASQWSYVSGATGKLVEGQSCDSFCEHTVFGALGRLEQRLDDKLSLQGWSVDDITLRSELGLDFHTQLRTMLDPMVSEEVKSRTRCFVADLKMQKILNRRRAGASW